MITKQEPNQEPNKMKMLIKKGDQAFFCYCYDRMIKQEPNFLKDYYNANLEDEKVLNELYKKYRFDDCDLNLTSHIKENVINAFEKLKTLEHKQNSMKAVALSLEPLLLVNVYLDYMNDIAQAGNQDSVVVSKDGFFPPQNKSDKSNTEKSNCCGCSIF